MPSVKVSTSRTTASAPTITKIGGRAFSSGAVLHGEDHLTDFDFFALFYQNIFDCATNGRRNFYNSLVSLEFHHGLTLSDGCAG